MSIPCSAPWPISTALARAHELGLKVMIDQVLSHSSDVHPWFVESRASRDNAKADWYVWADQKPDGTAPNNWLSVFGGSAWQWDAPRPVLSARFPRQPARPEFPQSGRTAGPAGQPAFWLNAASTVSVSDSCNFPYHDQLLRDNPPAAQRDVSSVSAINPYGMQAHVYDKTQPENIAYLQRVRAVLDEYQAISIGEVGDDNALATMAAYTGGDKLHMAYSFNLLTAEFSAAHIRIRRWKNSKRKVADGWASWSVGNHDSVRVMTRWGGENPSPCWPRWCWPCRRH
jgi:alpha-glucosidase